MEVRLTEPEDYNELKSWWDFWRFPAPELEHLPNNMKDGIMVTLNGENIVAGFIYRTPSTIYWFEFIVSNPHIKDKQVRSEAMELLINAVSDISKKMGAKHIFTSLKNKSLIKYYEAGGYLKLSTGTTEMIKIL